MILAGRATGTQITFPQLLPLQPTNQRHCYTVSQNKNLNNKLHLGSVFWANQPSTGCQWVRFERLLRTYCWQHSSSLFTTTFTTTRQTIRQSLITDQSTTSPFVSLAQAWYTVLTRSTLLKVDKVNCVALAPGTQWWQSRKDVRHSGDKNHPLLTKLSAFNVFNLATMSTASRRQSTNDLVHIWATRSSSGGNSCWAFS